MMTPHGFHAPRRQRGVIGLLGAIVMLLVAVCIALALDTGRLYMEKRNLQRVADLAALSVASRCETLFSCVQAVTYAQDVLEDNGYARELVDSDGITLGRVRLEDVAGEGGSISYRRYEFDSSLAQDAVQVVLKDSVSPPLMAAFMPDDDSSDDHTITLQSTAVARKTSYVAFSVGSRLASLDSSESSLLAPLLGGLLGSDVPLSLVGYEGVLDTRITLLELASEMPGVGVDLAALTVDEVLNTTLTLSELLEASESALSDQGVAASQLTLLDDMESGVDPAVGSVLITLGDLLDIQSADGVDDIEALKAGVRLGDLLGSSLLLANQDNAITLDNLDVDLSGVAASVGLHVVEAPQIAIGPTGCADGAVPDCGSDNWNTIASNGQLDLDVVLGVELLGVLKLDLGLDIDAVEAEAGIEAISSSEDGYDISVGATSEPLVASVGLEAEVLPAFAGLINVTLENASPENLNEGASGYMTGDIHAWPDDDAVVLASGVSGVTTAVNDMLTNLTLDVSLGDESEECSGLFCSITGALLDPVNDLLDGVVDSVSDLQSALGGALGNLITPLVNEVVEPLLGAAGLGIGEAEVRVIEVSSSGVELVQ